MKSCHPPWQIYRTIWKGISEQCHIMYKCQRCVPYYELHSSLPLLKNAYTCWVEGFFIAFKDDFYVYCLENIFFFVISFAFVVNFQKDKGYFQND
jgi:hypothetical protein